MANYSTLKTAVANVVKTNGEQAITGANLQTVLLSIINSIGGGGYIFEGVATPSTDAGTPDQNVFYIGGAGTYANFGTSVTVLPTNIAVFKYNGTWTCEQVTVENGGVFDISAFKAVGGTLATYADLSAALGTGGANVPDGVRKGGMSIKFVQSSDNKYVQYRYMGTAVTGTPNPFLDTANWQGVDNKLIDGSSNLVMNGIVSRSIFELRNESNPIQTLIFKGADSVNCAFTPVPNKVYLLEVLTTDWSIPVLSTNTVVFGIKINNVLTTYITAAQWNDAVNPKRPESSYKLTAPTPSSGDPEISIIVRGVNDGKFKYRVRNITDFPLDNNVIARIDNPFVGNFVVNSQGVVSYLNTRLSVGFIKFNAPFTITSNQGYEFLVRRYDSETMLMKNIAASFGSSYSVTEIDDYYVVIIRKSDNTEISADDYNSALSLALADCNYYLPACLIKTEAELSLQLKKFVESSNINTDYSLFEKTKNILVINGVTNAQGVITYANNRITTCFLDIPNNSSIATEADGDYVFRVHTYTKETLRHVGLTTEWMESFTPTDYATMYYVLDVRRKDNEPITPSDFATAIISSLTGYVYYISPEIIYGLAGAVDTVTRYVEEQRESSQLEPFNLNVNLTGLKDMVWEHQNWVFPQVISYSGIRNCLYFGFTNQAGFTGVAQYDYDTKVVTKTFLKKNSVIDDHNLVALLMMSNRRLLCVYSGGHNTDKCEYVRIANAQESIESFGDVLKLESVGWTSYSQIFEYDGKIYLFYRVWHNTAQTWYWAYRISPDLGETWGDEVLLIASSLQYYCQFTETTTDGVLRMCCYSNPEAGDSAIRMGFLHLDNMTLYDVDNSTVIGTSSIPHTSITTLIPIPSGGKVNRLYNAARSAINNTLILYSTFTNDVSQATDGEYFIYDNGTTVKVADAGTSGFFVPKTQLGVAWVGTGQIAVARGASGQDIIEIYDYINGSISLNRTIISSNREKNGIPIRTGRPEIDNQQKALLYLQGYFYPYDFYNFEMDAFVVELI